MVFALSAYRIKTAWKTQKGWMGLFSPGRQFEVLRSHPAFGTMIPIVIISFIFSPVGICLVLMGSLKLSRAVLVCLWMGDQVVLAWERFWGRVLAK